MPDDQPLAPCPVPGTADEPRRVVRFELAILIRAIVGTALWLAMHRGATPGALAMTGVLVATCWGPWLLVRAGRNCVSIDRERARGHLLNASAVVFLATAIWTIWGLVLAGRGKEVEGTALAVLWSFLFLCFVVDFWLFRWGLRALPAQSAPAHEVTVEEARRAYAD
ncbi:MAG: hypothetical protein K8T90_18915 [Planctomycetes bacterium]|nr:hypothetical protein [Planctomycetota bacterium]